jgi:hypothetical protein
VERLFGAAAERLDTDRMELTTTPGQTTSTQTTVTIPVAPSAP